MEGKKHDDDKARMDLIPASTLTAMAEVFGFGAKKYGDYNWKGGIDHSRLYSATMRHLVAYWGGETRDPESGLNHLHHALTNLAMMADSPEQDNRRNKHESVSSNQSRNREDRSQTVANNSISLVCENGRWIHYSPC